MWPPASASLPVWVLAGPGRFGDRLSIGPQQPWPLGRQCFVADGTALSGNLAPSGSLRAPGALGGHIHVQLLL